MTNETAGNEMTILVVDRQQMVASGDVRTVVPLSVLEERTARQTNIEQTLSKPQQRTGLSQWRKEIKMTLKASNKLNRESLAPGSMDKDLKRAILFGAVGLVALIIGGNAFQVIGGLSLLIGLVFLIKWLVRQ